MRSTAPRITLAEYAAFMQRVRDNGVYEKILASHALHTSVLHAIYWHDTLVDNIPRNLYPAGIEEAIENDRELLEDFAMLNPAKKARKVKIYHPIDTVITEFATVWGDHMADLASFLCNNYCHWLEERIVCGHGEFTELAKYMRILKNTTTERVKLMFGDKSDIARYEENLEWIASRHDWFRAHVQLEAAVS